jgi:hypothetical protein
MSATPASPKVRPTDVSTLLGIGRPGSRVILGLFAVGNAAFTLSTLDAVTSPWPSIAAMIIVSAAAIPLALPHKDPFPLNWTLWILATVLISTALISWQLAPEGNIGREAWHHGANTWLLFFLALRGRAGAAWLGFLGMAAITEAWVLDVGRSPFDGLSMLQTHAGILLVGTLFARALVRASERINSLNVRSVSLAAAAATADAEQDIRRERVAELSEVATPLLARISRSVTITDSDRIDYLLAEATLRDSVRARGLHLPEIVKATKEARRRGVDVTLLDDRGGGLPTDAAMRLLAARVTESLRNVDQGRLTIRLAPEGREIAASVVVESRGESRRIDLGEDGEPVESPIVNPPSMESGIEPSAEQARPKGFEPPTF